MTCRDGRRHEPESVPPTFRTIVAVCRICGFIFRRRKNQPKKL